MPDLPLSAFGDKAVKIFDRLRLHDVVGTPTMEEASGDWFRGVVRAMFGAYDPVTLKRAIREGFLLVPKKNSKTTNGALLMLTALLINQRPNAPFILTAPVQDVAEIAFAAVAGAIALDPVLEKKLHIREHVKTIVHRTTGAELQIMTFDPKVLTGQKAAGILIDELHVVAQMSKADRALRQLRGGMLPFPEAFLLFITTQSEEQPTGIFLSELTKAREIRDGKRRGTMLPVLYEFPEEVQSNPDLWRDPSTWGQVTPNDGRSITVARLVEEFQVAEQTSEEELRSWASQHLNLQIGLALTANSWVGAKYWESCAAESLTLDELLARSEVVCVGIDGGGLDDMLGLAVIGREVDTGKWLLWSHAWIHPIALERRKSEATKYLDFKKEGDLTIVDLIGQDVEQVADIVAKIEVAGLLHQIGVDQAGIGAIVDAIVDREVPYDKIVGIPQGWKMVSAVKTTERKLAGGSIVHGGTTLMNWCASNARCEARGNAVLITKQISGSAKIDPLMAVFDAITLMSTNPESKREQFQVMFV